MVISHFVWYSELADHTTTKFPVYDKHLPELRAAVEAHLKFVAEKWVELERLEARKQVVLQDHLGLFSPNFLVTKIRTRTVF